MASPTADFANYTALNIEAYPDPAPPIIEIIAQRPGQSPEEMERYVTIPIEIAIASTPGLNTVYALMDWPVMIGDWSVPMWVSWIGLVIAGGLAFFGLRLADAMHAETSMAASVRSF